LVLERDRSTTPHMSTCIASERVDRTPNGPGLLGDTTTRNYARKLQAFNAFAERELKQAVGRLGLQPGMQVLDAGCGTGEVLGWLYEEIEPDGLVVGLDLSTPHVAVARARLRTEIAVLQSDVRRACLAARSFDAVWSVNTLNHLRDPLAGVRTLAGLLRSGGRIVVGQSSFLPDMLFAWDARLERLVNDAVRRYYRERYRVSEEDLTDVRALVGRLRAARLGNVQAWTVPIERITPLAPADELYLLEVVFGSWSERLRPYLSGPDHRALASLCDPRHPEFALRRPDFHFLQTLTFVTGDAV
jgi:SAM-dependent methyltransferase